MQVNLYEWMINEDGKRSPGRQIGLIKFKIPDALCGNIMAKIVKED